MTQFTKLPEGKNLDAIMYAATKMTVNNLTDNELNALYMVSVLGTDPRHVMGYEKAQALFTEKDGTRMHSATLDAFERIWQKRIGSRYQQG